MRIIAVAGDGSANFSKRLFLDAIHEIVRHEKHSFHAAARVDCLLPPPQVRHLLNETDFDFTKYGPKSDCVVHAYGCDINIADDAPCGLMFVRGGTRAVAIRFATDAAPIAVGDEAAVP